MMPINPTDARDADLRPFYWTTGTLQLFVSHRTEPVWESATIGEYDRDKPVGSEWERRYTQRAVDILNEEWERGNRSTDQKTVRKAIKRAQQETPFLIIKSPSNRR